MHALIINIITQALIIVSKSLGQPKNDLAKIKKIIIGPKNDPAKTIFGQKSGPAMAGPAVPPTTALTILKSVLEQESNNLISWFFNNFTKANPDKFQAICIGKKAHDNIESFQIGQTNIKCEENVTLLGINIDFMLKFQNHVAEICKKASKN